MLWNIYYAKKNFVIDETKGCLNDPRQFIWVSWEHQDKIAFSYNGNIIFLNQTQFEENFPKSSVSTKWLKKVALSVIRPLMSRVAASKNPNLSSFKDKGSADILDILHQDNDYDSFNVQFNKQDELFTTARTELFHEKIKDFVERYPNATIVNIWWGLNPNIWPKMFDGELKSNNVVFYNIDLPEVYKIQKKVLEKSKNQILIWKSIFDFSWINQISKDRKILFVAEWMIMYFTKDQIEKLFLKIADNFPWSEIIFEAPSALVKYLSRFDPDLKETKTPFQFSISSGRKIEKRDSKWRITFVDESPLIKKHTDQRWILGSLHDKPIIGKLIQSMKKIIHLKIKE